MKMTSSRITYSKSGVDYKAIDPAKISAQTAARQTSSNLNRFKMQEIAESRGESAYVWREADKSCRALVVEGLGTKNLIADSMKKFTNKSYYDQIAQDTVAMIVNDLIVVGALPNVVNAYFAIGDSSWMNDKQRTADLIQGWAKACDLAGAAWGGGETPVLNGIINSETIDLAGSAIGTIEEGNLILGDKLRAGDSIILIASSGIHANGLTLARSVGAKAKNGFLTKLEDGRTYGEALLTPTFIYTELVRELQAGDIDIHYMVNITGHGWRKIMRSNKEFSYVMNYVPEAPEEFDFIQRNAKASDEEMYGNFNMGAGYAVFVPSKYASSVLKAAEKTGFKAWESGIVKKGPKQVVIKPKDIIFDHSTLEVR